jgi:hypothetical protein
MPEQQIRSKMQQPRQATAQIWQYLYSCLVVRWQPERLSSEGKEDKRFSI